MQAKVVLDELLEKLPDQLDLADIRARVDELTPYVMVALQVKQRLPQTKGIDVFRVQVDCRKYEHNLRRKSINCYLL